MTEIYPLRDIDHEQINASHKEFEAENEAAIQLAKSCDCAPMPTLNHLTRRDYQNVYEPSDDTFLLLDGLNIDFGNTCMNDDVENEQVERSRNNVKYDKNTVNTVEIGGGTGVASIFLAQLLSESHPDHVRNHFVTDINPEAIRITHETAQCNNNTKSEFSIQTIQCDLATELLHEHTNKIDVLLFNPPYVPTPPEEVGSSGIEASWAGGENGRVVTDRALPQIAQLLKYPGGVGYLITVDENLPLEMKKDLWDNYGMNMIPFVRRKAWNENLTVHKLTLTRKLSWNVDNNDVKPKDEVLQLEK